MNFIDLKNYNFSNDRAALRKELIGHFLDESPGTGKGDECSKYEYTMFEEGDLKVFLKRPAQFNNGFDFTIHVAGINFNPNGRKTSRPTHDNILFDLAKKKEENPAEYEKLRSEINKVYICQPYNVSGLKFNSGLPVATLVEVIRWLFAEQDVTYWNYSGRSMFYNGLCGI